MNAMLPPAVTKIAAPIDDRGRSRVVSFWRERLDQCGHALDRPIAVGLRVGQKRRDGLDRLGRRAVGDHALPERDRAGVSPIQSPMIGIIGDWTASIRDDIRMILQLVGLIELPRLVGFGNGRRTEINPTNSVNPTNSINPTNPVNLPNSINWSIL